MLAPQEKERNRARDEEEGRIMEEYYAIREEERNKEIEMQDEVLKGEWTRRRLF